MNTTSKWLSLVILLIAQLLTIMDIFIVNVALPSIQKNLHASQGDVQLIIAGYVLGFAIFLITGGRAGDYFGKKKVFILSLIAFGVISIFCGISQTPLQLNIARFFQGISASFMMPQVLAYVQILFPDQKERTKALGLYGVTIGLGTMLGQFLGGHLSSIDFHIAGWRWIFFINVPICLLALLASWVYLKETVLIKNEKFDSSGTVVLTVALISLIYPLTQGREHNWPLWCILLVILSVCLFYYFIKDQIKKTKTNKSPLIDVRLFKYNNFNIGLLVVSGFYMMLDSFF